MLVGFFYGKDMETVLTSQMQGRILTVAGVTIAICAAPFVAFLNMVTITVWPNWIAIAVCETLRKVCLL